MVIHWEHLSLSVQVSQRGPLVAASGDPEGGVLDDLEWLAGCSFCGREPDWGSVHEKRPYQCFISEQQDVLRLAPVCTCEHFDDFEFLCCSCGYCLDMVAEGEVGVEGYPEDFGVTFEGKGGVSKGDGRVEMGLVGVGSEEGDVGLGG